MKTNVLRKLAPAAVFVTALGAAAFAGRTFPKPQGWVSDFAGVIDGASKAKMETLIQEVERQNGAEIAVVTVPSLDGDAVENYAEELFKAWGVGKKGQDNGVLFLMSVEDRAVRIETGYGVEGVLPDGAAGAIIRQFMVPEFKRGAYGPGLLRGVEAVAQVLTKGSPAETAPAPRVKFSGLASLAALFCAFLLALFFQIYGFAGAFILTGVLARWTDDLIAPVMLGGFVGLVLRSMFSGGGRGGPRNNWTRRSRGFGGGSSGGGGASGRW